MDYPSFLKAADEGRTPPAALLHGPEPFLLEDALDRVTRGLFPDPAHLALAREVLDAREAGAEGIVRAALTLPWTTERRLVAVKGADALSPKQGEPLAAYLKSPNPSTVLLLLVNESLPASHWLVRSVSPTGLVPILSMAGRQLISWLRARARLDGFELGEEAASLLVELSGDDLTLLRGEVEKAALAGGPDNRRVGVAEVRAVVGEYRLRHVFDLTRALSRRDGGSALAVLESLLNGGEEPLAVLGMLAREVRALWLVADGLDRGRREEEIAPSLRRPPAAATAILDRARTLGPVAAARQLQRCWETERRLKLGAPARPELVLLVTDLCAG